MALEKIYTPIGWQNKPSTATPLGSHNLSKIDEALAEIDERVVELSEDTEELDGRVEDAETDITKNADDITTLENRFTGFSTAMSQGMQVLSDKVAEAEAKIEKNTEDIDALKIIPTASGTTAYMDDASNMNIENIVFYGESTQNGEPTPTNPIPIESKTVNRVDVLGKNSLQNKATSQTVSGIAFTVNDDKSVTANGTSTGLTVLILSGENRERYLGKEVILSGCPSGGGPSTYNLQCWHYDKNNSTALDYGSGAKFKFTNDTDGFNISIIIQSGVTVSNLTFKPMIRPSFFADATYEPYQSQTKILATGTYRLDGIGDLKNYYDAKRGVYGEKVDRVTFDGSDDEAWSFGTTNNGRRMQINIPVKPVSNVNVKGNVLCNRYIVTTAGENYMEKQGIAVDTSSRLYVYDANFKSSLISDWKAYLQANPMTVVYELAEPEEGNLISSVKDDFAEFLKLHTYKPNTVVMNGADAEMDVHYVADPRLYIDKKFETLASAIVNQ